MSKNLEVRLHGRLCGWLERGDGLSYRFRFDPTWIENPGPVQLSLSLPVEEDVVFNNARARPFFRGLLPEGTRLQEAAGRLDINDDHAILAKIGWECAGAVSVVDPDAPPPGEDSGYQEVCEADLEKAFRKQRSLIVTLGNRQRKPRYSVTGAQPKELLIIDEGDDPRSAPIRVPVGMLLSTHIIKAEAPNFGGAVWNEHFCLEMAEALGIRAAKSWIRRLGEVPCLIVERFDRLHEGTEIRRVHQEDIGQALGVLPESKYEFDDNGNRVGIGLDEMFSVLGRTSVPLLSRRAVRRLVLFNFLIANADAHAKNYSIMHRPDGTIEPSPAYDVVCTAVFDVDRLLAMAIGEETDPDNLSAAAWGRFAKTTGTSERALLADVKALCNPLVEASHRKHAEIVAAFPESDKSIRTVIGHMCRRAQDMSEWFGLDMDFSAEPEIAPGGWPAW